MVLKVYMYLVVKIFMIFARSSPNVTRIGTIMCKNKCKVKRCNSKIKTVGRCKQYVGNEQKQRPENACIGNVYCKFGTCFSCLGGPISSPQNRQTYIIYSYFIQGLF